MMRDGGVILTLKKTNSALIMHAIESLISSFPFLFLFHVFHYENNNNNKNTFKSCIIIN